MNICLYQSAASLSALERWQEAVAQNITSSQIPGFRKRTVEFASVEMGHRQIDAKGKADEGSTATFPSTKLGVSFYPGETTPTRRDMDVAISGDGFFEVQRADGSRGYTRAGQFHVNSQRMIVTHDDMPVLSAAGTPIVLQPTGEALSIAFDGALTQGDRQLGTLSVMRFADNKRLMPAGDNMYLAPEDMDPVRVERPTVLQGYIEASNVTPLREMISLVQIARAYEANQKIISNRDQNFQKALDTLG